MQSAKFKNKLGKLRVAANHRYLEYDDGAPFFYLGDTAWELFHRLNREEAHYYLSNRAASHVRQRSLSNLCPADFGPGQ